MLRRRQDGLEPFFLEDLLICTGQVLRTVPQVWIGKRLNWNTRPEELTRRMTGDELVKGAITAHRAITIERPPEKVWPWIAQFGRGAGYYSWDFLDNRGHRHADYLLDVPNQRLVTGIRTSAGSATWRRTRSWSGMTNLTFSA